MGNCATGKQNKPLREAGKENECPRKESEASGALAQKITLEE
jgi:hypothetical protein